ncbi:hypothetical protein [Endothiovibrio diazotrophicus]
MRRSWGVSWFLLSALPVVVAGAEIRLEGVNILGASKSAYLTVDGKRSRFREGESMGGWTVERIAPRSVDLRTPKGELRTLTLRGTSGSAQEAPKDAGKEEAGANFRPRVIDDRDVPPGYRKVRTPFGDVLVDKSKQGGTLLDENRGK